MFDMSAPELYGRLSVLVMPNPPWPDNHLVGRSRACLADGAHQSAVPG